MAEPGPAAGRALAVDLGSARIGIAVSDRAGTMAFPRPPLLRSGDRDADLAALAALVAEEGATTVVVGLPRSLDGRLGPAARAALDEVEALRAVLAASGVAVATADERFTTVTAAGRLAQAGKRGRAARRAVDGAAAAVLLEAWLAGR